MVCALVLHHLCLRADWLPWSTRTGKLKLKLGKSRFVSGVIFINHRLTEVGRDLGLSLCSKQSQPPSTSGSSGPSPGELRGSPRTEIPTHTPQKAFSFFFLPSGASPPAIYLLPFTLHLQEEPGSIFSTTPLPGDHSIFRREIYHCA